MPLEYRILGPLEVSSPDGLLPLGGAKQRSLLALLLLGANRMVQVDQLADALWSGKAPGRPDTAIQGYVSQLRKLLGAEAIRTHSAGYELVVDQDQADAARFERLSAAGVDAFARGNPAAAARILRDALALWRGPPLVDFAYEAWAQSEVQRLDEMRLSALEGRIRADLELGRDTDLVGELEALIADEPLREHPRGLLMLALYRSGRQAEALEAFQQARRMLVEELGIEPSAELKDLNRRILNQDPDLARPAHRLEPPTNLPAPANPLVGRTDELARVRDLLLREDVRLLTVTGPGGIGKTRFALELARRLVCAYPDGVYGIELAGLRDPMLVVSTIAQAVRVTEVAGEPLPATLHGALREREMLLLLDNFEHVLPAAADIAELLSAAQRLTILATSRIPLAVAAEHEFALPPLPPGEAIDLFSARARAVSADFELTDDNFDVVTGVCSRLDGLPLAIELAAARTKLLSPEALHDRLEQRLPLLTGGRRDLPERQQTLRAAIDWSYELLGAEEQELFERLAVFEGGWSIEAAESACDASLEALSALVDQSLIRPRRQDRFEMLETIREYALEKLRKRGVAEFVQRRQAAFFEALVAQAEPELSSGAPGPWLDRLERDHDNLRAAIDYAMDRGDGDMALRIAAPLWRFWLLHGHLREGLGRLEAALAAAPDAPPLLRADACTAAAALAHGLGRFDVARHYCERSLEIHRDSGDVARIARSLSNLGNVFVAEGHHDGAQALFEEALGMLRPLGQDWPIAVATVNLGWVAEVRGDYREAIRNCEESLRLFRALGDTDGSANSLISLGRSWAALGDSEQGLGLLRQALTEAHALDYRQLAAVAIDAIAAVVAESEHATATRLFGASEALRESVGAQEEPTDCKRRLQAERGLRSALGDRPFEDLRSEGVRMSFDDAVATATAVVPDRVGAHVTAVD